MYENQTDLFIQQDSHVAASDYHSLYNKKLNLQKPVRYFYFY